MDLASTATAATKSVVHLVLTNYVATKLWLELVVLPQSGATAPKLWTSSFQGVIDSKTLQIDTGYY